MGCGCGGRATGVKKPGDTLGYYVVLPDKSVLPEGFDPSNPEGDVAPYFSPHEARTQVTLNAGGTIRRAKKPEPVAAPA